MKRFLASLLKTLGLCCFVTGFLMSANVFADEDPGMPTIPTCTGAATTATACTANLAMCPTLPPYSDCVGIMKADTITFDYCGCI
jgi:hypothetical protein